MLVKWTLADGRNFHRSLSTELVRTRSTSRRRTRGAASLRSRDSTSILASQLVTINKLIAASGEAGEHNPGSGAKFVQLNAVVVADPVWPSGLNIAIVRSEAG